ncbi:beta-glucosidase BglX [Marinifilum breve]|uniref:Periplasmic beta-glucosidase n=1 Tax=Marinifilum breve TaxID=2184082 RepID=A0A2V4A2J3_9BACT|nr:beta-glucosidase BglX [Marinifilum breve]PXY03135.1 beta-glucosidase BglX [Marinifilum breve]
MKKVILLLWVMAIQVPLIAQDKKMDQFIDDLMDKMTLQEKLGQLNLSSGVGNLKVITEGEGRADFIRQGLIGASQGRKSQEIAVKESRLGIPLIAGKDVIHGHTTTFPIPLAMACMWDLDLIEKHARIAAEESSVLGINWTYSPMVDISRDPRWGRCAEGAGEDTWYGSQVAKAYVKGYQGDDLSKPNTIMACVKHFALYGASEAGRDYNTVDMSRQVMFQDFLPPYKAAFDAGAGSAMSSFNLVDGIPATGNQWLMTDLLRTQWGFDGFVVTDFTAINEMIHHGMGNLEEVSVQALKAGIDMDMVGQGFIGTLSKSVEEGKISMEYIDTACRRVLEAKYKLGLFEKPFQYFNPKKAKQIVLSDEHLAEARNIAKRSIVLLKNDKQTLPLKKKGSIAVVGPLADSKMDMLGTWAGTRKDDKIVTILNGIKNVGDKAEVLYAKGSYATEDPFLLNRNKKKKDFIVQTARESAKMLEEAKETAAKADVIVAVLGEPRAWSGEAASRADIGIPECQRRLLKAMLATGKPVVLVLSNGRPMTLTWEDANVDAILETWHLGTEAGNAIADVLFGDYNPAGKITATFPVSVGQIPIYYNHKRTGRPIIEDFKFTSKYLDIPNEPLYPFGYGLSYTNFEYSDIKLDKSEMGLNDTITATVTVKNTGKFDGEEVVQLYINDPAASISRPVKELKGFEKVMIKKGEKATISFAITAKELAFFRKGLSYGVEAGDFNLYIGTNSSEVKEAQFHLKDSADIME